MTQDHTTWPHLLQGRLGKWLSTLLVSFMGSKQERKCLGMAIGLGNSTLSAPHDRDYSHLKRQDLKTQISKYRYFLPGRLGRKEKRVGGNVSLRLSLWFSNLSVQRSYWWDLHGEIKLFVLYEWLKRFLWITLTIYTFFISPLTDLDANCCVRYSPSPTFSLNSHAHEVSGIHPVSEEIFFSCFALCESKALGGWLSWASKRLRCFPTSHCCTFFQKTNHSSIILTALESLWIEILMDVA